LGGFLFGYNATCWSQHCYSTWSFTLRLDHVYNAHAYSITSPYELLTHAHRGTTLPRTHREHFNSNSHCCLNLPQKKVITTSSYDAKWEHQTAYSHIRAIKSLSSWWNRSILPAKYA
jgi:hypothetical protein